MDKQLNVWIDEQLKEALAKRAQEEDLSVKMLTERILGQAVAQFQGEIIERQALPIIRDLVKNELNRALVQLLAEVRDHVHGELLSQIKYQTNRSHDDLSQRIADIAERVAALSVRTVRDGSINRHLNYAMLAAFKGPGYAQEAYEHAKDKAYRELEAHTIERGREGDE